MNEVARIHLARVSYEIDLAAKKELEKYLTDIRTSLGKDDDAMEDIEIRMTEILAVRGVVKDSIITINDIKALKEQLGEPQDFAPDEDKKSDASSGNTVADKTRDFFASKKYYRDKDNAVLGGVLAGLAAYTGWDVTLLRVLYVVLVFCSWGFLIILYLVVWICAPEATSVSEKLEMRGKAVNLDSIKKSAKDIGEKAEKAGKTMAAKTAKVAKEIEYRAPTVGNIIARIIGISFGTIGLAIILGLVIGTIVFGSFVIFSIANMDVAAKPLLIVAVSLGLACMVNIIALFTSLVISLITGNFSKHARAGIVATIVFIVLLFAGAIGTSMAWYTTVGHKEAENTVLNIVDEVHSDGMRHGHIDAGFCIGICR